MRTYNELEKALLTQSENQIFHSDYENELNFYRAVQVGNTEQVTALFTSLSATGMGVLSKNPLRNIRYHFIVSVSMITRFCIEGGLPTETAYTLSDLYIRRADVTNSEADIAALHREMVFDFTSLMKNTRTQSVMSVIALQAIDYIHKNLRSPMKESEIAEVLHVNGSYLSSLFKKETGIGMKAYIQSARVEAAKNMLKYSDYDYAVISNYLCFSSHSYFISVFKKHTGMTPKEYRNRYFRSNWNE